MSYNYWMDEVGFITRDSLKEIIHDPECGFTGFRRYPAGRPGAYAFVCYKRKTVKLDVISQNK